MSRAFVKEPDGADIFPDLPERLVSEHRNFVTATGLAQIHAEIAVSRERLTLAQTQGEKGAIASASRDLRYWMTRRSSAELVALPTGPEVRFGSVVAIERADGRNQTFQITGEDEADPSAGTISYVSPLARAVTGRVADEEVDFLGEDILVLSVKQG